MNTITYRYVNRKGIPPSVSQLAEWVAEKDHMAQWSKDEHHAIARLLLIGGEWKPAYVLLRNPEALGPCDFELHSS